jgi:replicative DNA helicase
MNNEKQATDEDRCLKMVGKETQNSKLKTQNLTGLQASRSMPESLAAEAAVLGSMIIDPVCIGLVVEQLDRNAFYRVQHQLVFDAIIALYEKNRGVGLDAVLLRDELEKRGQLEEVGGVEYLAKVIESVPTTANVMYYAGIVKEKMLLREVITAAGEILDDAFSQSGDTGITLDQAERRIFSVTDKNIRGSATPLKDLVSQAFELIMKREGTHVTGLATGFHQLDDLTCGLHDSEMIILAGRPSMGKTSLALNIAGYLGLVEKVPVAIFSLEMSKQQLAERILCSKSEIDSQRIRKGMLSSDDYDKIKAACGDLYEVPIYVDDTSLLTPLELRAKARRLKSLYGLRCIIVDYLQLMSLGSRVESRQQEITAISRYIKALAGELSIPVMVLSQLNRAPEGREDHRPRMSDLRESGSIEQDADVVILLHREDYYRRGETAELSEGQAGTGLHSMPYGNSSEDGTKENNTAELIIAKQRNGPTDTVKLVFRKKIMTFENYKPEDHAVPF